MRSGGGVVVVAALALGQPPSEYAHPTWLSLTSKSQCVEKRR